MYCTNCGKELPNDANFCSYCGKQVFNTQSDTYTHSHLFFYDSYKSYYVKDAVFYVVEKNNKSAILDGKTLKLLTDFEFDFIVFNDWFYDCVIAKKNGKYGIINLVSGEVITPYIYDKIRVYDIRMDSHYVEMNNKCGVIDKYGNEIVPCIYDKIESADWSLNYFVKKNGLWGSVDKHGKEIVPCIYDYLSFTYPSKLKGKYGLLDSDGKIILDFVYDEINLKKIDLLESGRYYIFKKGEYYGCYDKRYGVKTECIYDKIITMNDDSSNSYFLVEKDGRFGYYDNKRHFLSECEYLKKDDAIIASGNLTSALKWLKRYHQISQELEQKHKI